MAFSGITRSSCALLTAALALVAGCGTNGSVQAPASSLAGLSGSLHGGQQPIFGATVQLYAVGMGGDGSASTALLTRTVTSDVNGAFRITGAYTCPSASTQVYLVGTGGNSSPGINNPQIALMVAIGSCGSLTPSTFLSVNEVTTVAAVYALAPYMTSLGAIGSGTSDASALASAFTYANQLANSATGASPGTPPNGFAVPFVQVNTIANILATCINSSGGTYGDSSSCGTFFSLTYPGSGATPTDAVAALLNLANHPTLNTASLYGLASAKAPFQPSDSSQPPDLAIVLVSTAAPLAFAPSAGLNFPSTAQTTSSSALTATLTNSSGTAQNVSLSISGSEFTQTNNCPSPLPNFASCSVYVTYTPQGPGQSNGTLTATGGANTATLPLQGTGQPTTLTVSTFSLTLPDAAVQTQSGAQSVTLTNIGKGSAILGTAFFTGTQASQFAQTNTCPGTLAEGSSCSFSVTDTPTAVGPTTATLNIPSNGSPSSLTVAVSGSGASGPPPPQGTLHVSQTELFVDPSTSAPATLLDLTNVGTNPISISSFTFSPSGSFSQSNTCGSSLAVGATCIVTLAAAPSSTGLIQSTLTINSNGSVPAQNVALYTAGYFSAQQNGVTYATVANFGRGPVGAVAPRSFYYYSGQSNQFVTGYISGTNASDFTFAGGVNSCRVHCYLTVQFTPSAAGLRFASLDIGGNIPVVLVGFGYPSGSANSLTFSPSSLTFPQTALGAVSAPQTITVANPLGHLLNFVNRNTEFSVSPATCAATSCTLNVAFTPTSVPGFQAATATDIFIQDSATFQTPASSPAASGYAGIPGASFSATTVNLGSVLLGSSSSSQSVTTTFTGDSSTSVAVSGPVASGGGTDFADTRLFSPGGTDLHAYTFSPTRIGAQTATVSAYDSRTGLIVGTYTLTGTGITSGPGNLKLSVNALAFTRPATQSFTAINTGSSAIAIPSITMPAGYTETDNCVPSLGSGATCTVNVTVTDWLAPSVTSKLVINDSDTTDNETVTLTYPPIYSMGAFQNQSQYTGVVKLKGPDSSTPQGHTLYDSVSGSPLFGTTNGSGCSSYGTLGCTLTVDYYGYGTLPVATLLTYSIDNGPQQQYILYAQNFTAGTAAATLSDTSSYAFGLTTLTEHNSTPNAVTLYLSNVSTTTLQIPGLSAFTSYSPTAVPAITTCGTTLGPNASCQVTFTYTQPTVGLDSFHVGYTDAASGKTFDTFVNTNVVSP